jgi:hypothetical protein
MHLRQVLCCLICLVLVSCAVVSDRLARRALTTDEEDLVLATFHQFYGMQSEPWQGLVADMHGQPHPADPTTRYYITIFGQDVSSSLLARFRTTYATFHPGSQFHDGDGVHFEVEKIALDASGEAIVAFTHYCGPECGSEEEFYFKKVGMNWQFVRAEELSVS